MLQQKIRQGGKIVGKEEELRRIDAYYFVQTTAWRDAILWLVGQNLQIGHAQAALAVDDYVLGPQAAADFHGGAHCRSR